MNPHYVEFVELGKSLARDKGLVWDFVVDEDGCAIDGIGWNLTACVGDVPPPAFYLRDLGYDAKSLEIASVERPSEGLLPLTKRAPSPAWQDFIKAAVAEQLFVKRNSTGHVNNSIARPLRVLELIS